MKGVFNVSEEKMYTSIFRKAKINVINFREKTSKSLKGTIVT